MKWILKFLLLVLLVTQILANPVAFKSQREKLKRLCRNEPQSELCNVFQRMQKYEKFLEGVRYSLKSYSQLRVWSISINLITFLFKFIDIVNVTSFIFTFILIKEKYITITKIIFKNSIYWKIDSFHPHVFFNLNLF